MNGRKDGNRTIHATQGYNSSDDQNILLRWDRIVEELKIDNINKF